MSNHVNDIEQISRQAAENFDAGIDPQWDQFLPKLNEAMPQPARRRRRFFWWFMSIMLVSIGCWIGYTFLHPSTNPKNNSVKGKDVHLPQTNTGPTTEQTKNETLHPKASSAITIADNKHLQRAIVQQKKSADTVANHKKVKVANTSVRGLPQVPASSNFISTVGANAQSGIPGMRTSTELVNNAIQSKASSSGALFNVAESTAHTKDNAESTNLLPQKTEPKLMQNTNDTARTALVDTLLPRKLSPSGAWSVAILGAADISTVRFTYAHNVSYGYGAVVGYHFNNHWSVHAGLIYTQKNYKAAGADFNVPKSSWLSNYTIIKVAGTCSMWEMPLTSRYTFHLRPKQSYFASLGLSTYFMQSEKYTYQYYYQQRLVSRTIQYSNKNNYWGAVAHVSAGISKALLPNVWLQIEPYAKIPLKGVGFGSISLTSMGINAGLQWKRAGH